MRFNRLFTTSAVTGTLCLLIITACSEDEQKPSGQGGQDSGGSAGFAGQSSAPKGGSGGTTTMTTTTTVALAGGSGGLAGQSSVAVTGGTASLAGAAGAAGATVAPQVVQTLDDLIGAVCDWEFRCCSAGEIRWELGPTTTNATACKEKFVYLLRNDTAADPPYPEGSNPAVLGLLTQLGYQVDLSKVTEDPNGIAACVAQWATKSCNPLPGPAVAQAHCTEASSTQTDPCALNNLVTPKLGAGEICNFSLTESATNDVECVPGTTCLDTTNPDNRNKTAPTCVTRGVANAFCTFDKDCDFGYYCSSSTGKCTEKGSVGAACSFKTPNAPKPGAVASPCKPGLSCNPVSLKCVKDCSHDAVCNAEATDKGNDYACPTGSSCIPITVPVNSDTTSFKACRPLSIAAERCNSLEDCAAGLYCDGTGVCAPRLALDAACSPELDGQCAAGHYCNGESCAALIALNGSCEQTPGTLANQACNPATTVGCVFQWDATNQEIKHVCSNALLVNGQRCGADIDCQSARCEFAGTTATFKTCIEGAKDGEICDMGATSDELTSVDGRLRCKAGSRCDDTSGLCVALAGPGGSCADATGAKDDDRCSNTSCNATQWTEIDPSLVMCTDAAVNAYNGGTGVICDGR